MNLYLYHLTVFFGAFIPLSAPLTACNPTSRTRMTTIQSDRSTKLQVVATTTIVGDVVKNVGGDAIALHILLPVGADPHTFDPTPQDIATLEKAEVIFANGAGLEEFLDVYIKSSGAEENVVSLSAGVPLLRFDGTQTLPHQGEENTNENSDPHTWTDPHNVILWVRDIEHALSERDPENKDTYQANAERYTRQLEALDAWVREQVAQVPPESRLLVTDHQVFAYFAAEYGFTQIGAIIPGYSTLAEPSAQDIARLEDTIQRMNVKAVFVGKTVNPHLAQRLVEDSGVRLVFVYTGSLSEKGGEADNYIDYIRYNVTAIVNALK